MKQKGFITVNIMIAVLILVIAISGAGYAGSRIVDNYRADSLVRQCNAIDNALLMYAKAHRQVAPENVRFQEQSGGSKYLFYTTGKIYPRNLNELGTVRDEQGYFSQEIDLSQFTYQTQTKADGSMTYTLEVTMPNGNTYVSPLSEK